LAGARTPLYPKGSEDESVKINNKGRARTTGEFTIDGGKSNT